MNFQTIWNEIVELYNDNLNAAENIIQHDWEKRILPKNWVMLIMKLIPNFQ